MVTLVTDGLRSHAIVLGQVLSEENTVCTQVESLSAEEEMGKNEPEGGVGG